MATRYFPPRSDAFDANGNPISGAKLFFYEAGTSTPLATYSDAALTVANSNPVVADSAGRFGEIFLLDNVAYKAVLADAADVTIWTADPYVPVTAAGINETQASFKNLLVNGQFDLDSNVITTAADAGDTLDRWYALTSTGSVTVAQQTLQTNGIKTNIRLTQPDVSAKRFGLAQFVESATAQPLRGASVSLSGFVRVTTSQAVRYAILSHTGTADAVTRDVVNDWASGSYTAGNFFIASNLTVEAVGSITPNAATWTALTTLTATLSSSVQNVIVIFWTETTAAQNFNLDIANVQLERGDGASNFEYLPKPATGLVANGTITRRLSQALTGGSVDFTGIPAGVKRITVSFLNASFDGTDGASIILGDSGGFETVDYSGNIGISAGASAGTLASLSSGIAVIFGGTAAGDVCTGKIELLNQTGNIWVCTGVIARSGATPQLYSVAAVKGLSGPLDRIRFDVDGASSFDNGEITIFWET